MLQSISPPEHPLGIPSERPLSDIELGPRSRFFELINAALARQCHRRGAAAFDFAHRLWLVGDRRGLARPDHTRCRCASRRCHSYPDSGRRRNDDPRRNDTHDTWPYETHPVRKSRHRLDQYFWSASRAVVRVAAAFEAEWAMPCLIASACFWISGFGLFLLSYGPFLLKARDVR
jgi:hypothetical protein